MKKKNLLHALTMGFMSIGVMAISFTSCEGPAGVDGEDGEQGPAGQDANATCTQCHDGSTDLTARSAQYEASTHATGGNSERDGASCAPCHTHEGFIDRMATGEMTSIDPDNPSQPGCRTCHMIHTNYDASDWAIRSTDPVDLWTNDETVNIGNGNLCAQCHQPRVIEPMPVVGGEAVEVTSSRYGPHHGPQSTVLTAKAGYETPNADAYASAANHPHAGVTNGCVTCHMAEPYGTQSGGHTMKMAYEYHGSTEYNVAGCTACHSDEDALATKLEDFTGEIEGLMTSLHGILVTEGLIEESGSVVPQTMSADQAGAVLNYKTIEEDRSKGVHNPTYVRTLLENSIALFN